MSVPQFTTPTFTLTFTEQGLDLTQAENVYVTFQSKGYKLTKTSGSLTVGAKTISVHLTQRETSRFSPGTIEIQANWTTANGDRIASEIAKYTIDRQLLIEVIQ